VRTAVSSITQKRTRVVIAGYAALLVWHTRHRDSSTCPEGARFRPQPSVLVGARLQLRSGLIVPHDRFGDIWIARIAAAIMAAQDRMRPNQGSEVASGVPEAAGNACIGTGPGLYV
jgi:hypothetical protein